MSNSQSNRGRGDKRASWYTFHRRLFLVRCLVRGPAEAEMLIREARAFFRDDEVYPPDARAALRHDVAALRNEFECDIRLMPDKCYALVSFGRLALLDLPDDDLETLAFLLANFSESTLPNAGRVDALLDRIIALLPDDRRATLHMPARDIRLDYPQPSAAVAERTIKQLRRALGRQEVSFTYRSTYVQGDTVVQHRVAPYDLLFRDGHTYLDAFCYDCGVAEIGPRYRLYRTDRIIEGSLRLLPNQLPPGTPPRRWYPLRYILSPAVARQKDIAVWFQKTTVVFREDGSAYITAEAHDLWQARQVLLRYREHCQVLGPPELVEMMRESVRLMWQMYDLPALPQSLVEEKYDAPNALD